MTGRGIDQVLPYSNDAQLYEPGAHSASRQHGDAARFDGPMHRWMEAFLDRHLIPAALGGKQASSTSVASTP